MILGCENCGIYDGVIVRCTDCWNRLTLERDTLNTRVKELEKIAEQRLVDLEHCAKDWAETMDRVVILKQAVRDYAQARYGPNSGSAWRALEELLEKDKG